MARSSVFHKPVRVGPLTEYLERIKQLREYWAPRLTPERRGEDHPLWFRGHQDAAWKLTPRLYRKDFAGADETEIRQEFQSRALQLIQTRLPAAESRERDCGRHSLSALREF